MDINSTNSVGDLDITGRDRFARNIGAGYLGHVVFIVLGFVMPRIIDGHVGQEGLGVWDFAWSFVGYLSLSMIGIGSAVNRYVATYRAAGDIYGLNRLVSTVVALQLVIATVVLALGWSIAYLVPDLFAHRLGEFAGEARWVIGFLGTSLAFQMAFDAWRGVISGCHRWDYYNAINATGYAVASFSMIGILIMDGGLRDIAAAYLSVTILTEFVRFRVAHVVCPEIKLTIAKINLTDARRAISFGVKTILLGLPSVLVIQTVNLLVVASLGPSMLAILARPISLIHHVATLMNKYSYILTPMAGSIQEKIHSEEFKKFAMEHARAGWSFAIPPVAFLFVLGDVVLEVWMGPDYAFWYVTAMLSAGYLLPISQSTILRVLVGLNAHGLVAGTGVLISACALSIGLFFANKFGWSLALAAAVIAGAAGFGAGLNVLLHAIRHLNVSATTYWREVGFEAIVLLFAIAVPLVVVRFLTQGHPLLTIGLSMATTTISFAIVRRRDLLRIIQRFRRVGR